MYDYTFEIDIIDIYSSIFRYNEHIRTMISDLFNTDFQFCFVFEVLIVSYGKSIVKDQSKISNWIKFKFLFDKLTIELFQFIVSRKQHSNGNSKPIASSLYS